MKKISNLTITLRTLKHVLLSFEGVLTATALLFLVWDRSRGSLFGRDASDLLVNELSFAPADPFAKQGLTLLSYPFVHQGFEHLAVSGLILILLGIRLSKAVSSRHRIIASGIATIAIALSYLLSFAPLATAADRVFGSSALAHAYLGASLVLKPTLLATSIFFALLVVTIWGEPSALTLWGHAAGFTIGLSMAVLFRLVRSRYSSAASA
jgi:membrane associated rhomboid family serine protease